MVGQQPCCFEERDKLGVTWKNAKLAIKSRHLDALNLCFENFSLRGHNFQMN